MSTLPENYCPRLWCGTNLWESVECTRSAFLKQSYGMVLWRGAVGKASLCRVEFVEEESSMEHREWHGVTGFYKFWQQCSRSLVQNYLVFSWLRAAGKASWCRGLFVKEQSNMKHRVIWSSRFLWVWAATLPLKHTIQPHSLNPSRCDGTNLWFGRAPATGQISHDINPTN